MPVATPQQGKHIDRWVSGLITNRAATSMPFRRSYGSVIQYFDALIDGSNVEITPSNTLARRPGFPKFNSSNALNGVEVPTGFFSAILSGTLYDFIDTTQNVYVFTSSSLTSIYSKTTTAQTRYEQVGNVVFFSDGAVNKKITIDSSGNIVVTNNGLTTPTAAPTIPNLNLYDMVGASQTVHAWVPSATYANTTASPQNYYLLASTGEVFWSVVPAGTTLQSQSVAPNWSSQYGVFGGVVKDGGMTWTNCGPILTWSSNTTFKNSTYVTVSQFTASSTPGTKTDVAGGNFAWTIGSASAGFQHGGVSDVSDALRVSNFGFAIPSGATIKGVQVIVYRAANRTNAIADADVRLMKAGVPGGTNKSTAGFWPQTQFNVNSIPTSGGVKQIYGSNTDLWGNTLTPTDINNSGFGIQFKASLGTSSTTAAALVYPITIIVTYTVAAGDITGTTYGQIIQDSNGNLQRCKIAGTSGGSQPTWGTTIGGTTAGDGGITWDCLGTANQLPCLFNRTYAFGFHSSGAVNHISTMSPTLVVQAPIVGLNVNVQGFGSDDTQVDRNDLYRTADGGSLLLYDTSTTNVNSATSWTINDTALDSDLNFLLTGPVAHANDPPPAGITNITYFMGRLWGWVGNLLYFSAGPDCVNGDGMQAWPPANVFTFSAPGYGFAPTTQGLVVATAKEFQVILGGPQTSTFWPQPLIRNFGILSTNCIAQEDDEIVAYTSQKQLVAFSPSSRNELGFNVAPTLAANFSPTSAYLAIHRNGQDQGLFIADSPIGSIDTALGTRSLCCATNATWHAMRYNMNAESWDALATIVGSNFITARSTTTFADSGAAYAAYATVGSVVLSEPGELPSVVNSILLTDAAVGTALTIAVLLNEIGSPGTFVNIPKQTTDPFQLAGTTYASQSLNMDRYDWKGAATPLPQSVKHLQVKITLPATDTVKNEIYTLGII